MTTDQLAVGLAAALVVALAALAGALLLAWRLRKLRNTVADLVIWANAADHDLQWAVEAAERLSERLRQYEPPTNPIGPYNATQKATQQAHGASAAGRHRNP